MEVIGADGQPVQPNQYAGIPNSVVTEFKYCEVMQGNIYNPQYLINMDDTWTNLPGYASEVFVANHDNERNSAGTSYLNYQDNGWAFQLAQSFMVAFPFGTVRQVYSGYQWSNHDQGGPLSSPRCQGGWHCEHRDSIVNNAVGFARATRGFGVSTKGSDGKLIWFNRGKKGFYAMNAGDNDVTKTFSVTVPDGQYCEILQQDDKCGGQQVTVSGGKATITVKAHKAAAICVDDSGRGFCGGETFDICEVSPDSEACFCKNNPNDLQCIGDVGDRYYVGTTTAWKTFTKMTFNPGLRAWTLDVVFDGEGDDGGVQRFKVTDQAGWKGTVWGAVPGGSTLCSDEASCKDVDIESLVGTYTLTVGMDNSFKLDKKGDDNVVSFTPSFTTTINGLKVKFTNTTFANTDEAAGAKYHWYFGDGGESSKSSVTHTYAESGKYKVVLKVKKNGKKLSVKKYVKVKELCKPNNPALYFAGTSTKWVAKPFTFNTDTCLWELGVKFTGKSDAGGKQRFKIYDSADMNGTVWGKGTKNTLCSNPSVCGDIFVTNVGKYTVKVNDYKLKYALEPIVSDSNHAPVASFNVAVDGLKVTVTSTAKDDDGNPLTYRWSFGDGSKGSGSVVTHTYDAEGSYKIKHVANDGKVDSATVAKVVSVTDVAIPKTHDALYFAGTSNSWSHDLMTYDPRTGNWHIDLVLSGQGDAKGGQRFKVTDTNGWEGTVWGDAGSNALCSDEAKCGDVSISESGNYTLYVNDADMTWSLVAR
jgi:alpha-amylase